MPLYVRTLLITGPADEVDSARRGHEEHLRALRDLGRLRAAGEFAGGDGYLEIFEAADRLEAERTAGASPLVSAGLGAWMLREWIELKL
jgi:uncharacterized protein YciI